MPLARMQSVAERNRLRRRVAHSPPRHQEEAQGDDPKDGHDKTGDDEFLFILVSGVVGHAVQVLQRAPLKARLAFTVLCGPI
jgi:hypothetical protein